MRRSAKLLFTAALMGGLATIPGTANALMCLTPPPPEQAASKVDALFTGTAVARVRPGATRFAVETVHLGDLDDTVVVATGNGEWAYTYEIGTRTTVAALRSGGALSAGPCPLVEGGPAALRDWLASR